MGEVEKCNTYWWYYTMYHKRRVEITRNTLCGKIPGSEIYNTPSFGQSTPCNETIASTERKKIVQGWSWKKSVTKTCDTYYTLYHERRVKITRNALCGRIPGSELYYTVYTPLLEKAQRALKLLGVSCRMGNYPYSNHVGNIASGENHPTFVF